MNLRRVSSSIVFINYVDELRRQILGVIAVLAVSVNALSLLVAIANQLPVDPVLLVAVVFYIGVLAAVVRGVGLQFLTNLVFVGIVIFITQLEVLIGASMIAVTALLTSALLVNRWVYALVLVVVPAHVLMLEFNRIQNEGFASFGSPLQFLIGAVVISIILRIFRERLDTYLETARQTSDLVQRANELSRALAAYTNDETALAQCTVNGLQNQMGFSAVKVYVVGQTNEATLVAASDSAQVGERLPINTRTIVGRALLSGETITLRADPTRALADPRAAQTTQVVIPLIDRERVIGALSLESSVAFTVEQLNALQVVTNSLTQGLQLARTFQQQQAALQQVRRLSQENETNQREVERLSRQLTRQAWSEYAAQEAVITGVTLQPEGFTPGAEWTELMLQAVQRRRVITHDEGNNRVVAVPIELRGETIGALQVTIRDTGLEAETETLLRAVADRLATSLENARLFEEAQAATIQEQRINEIVAELQTSETLETMLQRAIEGLAEALGAQEASIRLGSPVLQQAVNGGDHGAA